MKLSNRKSNLVNVNGIHLHYLDWGGEGPTLIVLTATGATAYIFDEFALVFPTGSTSLPSPVAATANPIALNQAMTQIRSQRIFVRSWTI